MNYSGDNDKPLVAQLPLHADRGHEAPTRNEVPLQDFRLACRDAGCIASLTRQFSTLASGLKTPMSQTQGGMERSESLEMHTMSSAELKRRHAPASLASLPPCPCSDGGPLASILVHADRPVT